MVFSVLKVDFMVKCLKTVMQLKGYVFFLGGGRDSDIDEHFLQLRIRRFLLDTSYSVALSTFLVPRMCRSLN